MDINFGTALAFTGVSLLILMVVLAALAGLIYFLTGVIKDKEEDEDEALAPVAAKTAPAEDVDRANRMKAALIAVALARSTRAGRKVAVAAGSETSAWKQFHQARRLNQTLRVRRPS